MGVVRCAIISVPSAVSITPTQEPFAMKFFRTLVVLCLGIVLGYGVIANQQAGFFNTHSSASDQKPQLAVVIVIDQWAYFYLHKLKPFLTGGIKKIIDHGTNYTHAVYPHAIPSTATGHAALSTGTCAHKHGIVSNSWVDSDGSVIYSTNSDPNEHGIFAQSDETYERGAGPNNLMVDSLSDAFMLAECKPHEKRMVFSLSFKDRSAIMLAGKMGKAFWFDEWSGNLTTSRAYYAHYPAWLSRFNAQHAPSNRTSITWKPIYKPESAAYDFSQAKNYAAAAVESLYNTSFKIKRSEKSAYELYKKTPHADRLVLSAAYQCLNEHYSDNSNERCLLWISLSSLDLAGHFFGPHSRETIDMIYQIDKALNQFINDVETHYPNSNTIWALTADHGVMPIPEVLNDSGFDLPIRIDSKALIDQLNKAAHKVCGINKLIIHHKPPQFFFDKPRFAKLSREKQKEVKLELAAILRKQNGVRHVWTNDDLEEPGISKAPFEEIFKQQYYPGRSGELCCVLQPYAMLSPYQQGTSHTTPYLYDTHVPLTIWHKNYPAQTITQPVSPLQLPTTLAHLFKIPFPSAEKDNPVLPGFC